jgi:hypothetical protein|tara:strand:- start:328 stop:999 length:672 start_codon:yes stop_codon:yes gene_type:complete
MKLILVGCEYSGTTTIAKAIDKWAKVELGTGFRLIHDHFKLPDTQPHGPILTNEEIVNWQNLSPRMVEVIQRHNLYYHTPSESSKKANLLIIGLHIDESIYGPLYYDYGHKGVIGDRVVIGRHIELNFKKYAPETVLVHVKATPEVIRSRMQKKTHTHQVIKDKDIEHILSRFEEEVFNSILNRIELDTSTSTVQEVAEDFAEKIVPYLTTEDQLDMLTNRKI